MKLFRTQKSLYENKKIFNEKIIDIENNFQFTFHHSTFSMYNDPSYDIILCQHNQTLQEFSFPESSYEEAYKFFKELINLYVKGWKGILSIEEMKETKEILDYIKIKDVTKEYNG